MAKFVPDIQTQRWIIISQSRWDRPDDHAHPHIGAVCAFCPGNESETPRELLRILSSSKAWSIRVIENKYPITDLHEVIIHSPDHTKDLLDLGDAHMAQVLDVYRKRFSFHKEHGQVMIFCNHGQHAGASLSHPHSQLVVLPRQINLDALVREPVMNVVEDTRWFVTYCPDFSQWPYEVWITPKESGKTYDSVQDNQLSDLASIIVRSMKRLRHICKNHEQEFAYNYYIHHAENWFLRIIPRLIHRAGFELGTGLSVNTVDPTDAASCLRDISGI